MKNITIELNWPPSINTYWRRNGNRYFISSKGIQYRNHVTEVCQIYSGFYNESERLAASIMAYPPDKRRRDLDNIFKGLMDSLQYAGVYVDDCQLDEIFIRRMPEREGKIIVKLCVIGN